MNPQLKCKPFPLINPKFKMPHSFHLSLNLNLESYIFPPFQNFHLVTIYSKGEPRRASRSGEKGILIWSRGELRRASRAPREGVKARVAAIIATTSSAVELKLLYSAQSMIGWISVQPHLDAIEDSSLTCKCTSMPKINNSSISLRQPGSKPLYKKGGI